MAIEWHRGIAASWHRGIAASRHRGIAASQHRGIAASRHRSIAASQHRSIAASQHRSIAASDILNDVSTVSAVKSQPVFVVDTCPVFIHGLSIWLANAGYALCGQADDVNAIDANIAGCAAEALLCIIGPHLHTRDAFAACRRIRASVSQARVVFITDHADDATFREDVADAGALACLPVTMTEETLLGVLPLVLAGQSLIAVDPDAPRVQPLSEREMDVLRLIEVGMTNPQIASALHVGVTTVGKHMQHIFEKLCVNSRQGAVHRAYHRGLL